MCLDCRLFADRALDKYVSSSWLEDYDLHTSPLHHNTRAARARRKLRDDDL